MEMFVENENEEEEKKERGFNIQLGTRWNVFHTRFERMFCAVYWELRMFAKNYEKKNRVIWEGKWVQYKRKGVYVYEGRVVNITLLLSTVSLA